MSLNTWLPLFSRLSRFIRHREERGRIFDVLLLFFSIWKPRPQSSRKRNLNVNINKWQGSPTTRHQSSRAMLTRRPIMNERFRHFSCRLGLVGLLASLFFRKLPSELAAFSTGSKLCFFAGEFSRFSSGSGFRSVCFFVWRTERF